MSAADRSPGGSCRTSITWERGGKNWWAQAGVDQEIPASARAIVETKLDALGSWLDRPVDDPTRSAIWFLDCNFHWSASVQIFVQLTDDAHRIAGVLFAELCDQLEAATSEKTGEAGASAQPDDVPPTRVAGVPIGPSGAQSADGVPGRRPDDVAAVSWDHGEIWGVFNITVNDPPSPSARLAITTHFEMLRRVFSDAFEGGVPIGYEQTYATAGSASWHVGLVANGTLPDDLQALVARQLESLYASLSEETGDEPQEKRSSLPQAGDRGV